MRCAAHPNYRPSGMMGWWTISVPHHHRPCCRDDSVRERAPSSVMRGRDISIVRPRPSLLLSIHRYILKYVYIHTNLSILFFSCLCSMLYNVWIQSTIIFLWLYANWYFWEYRTLSSTYLDLLELCYIIHQVPFDDTALPLNSIFHEWLPLDRQGFDIILYKSTENL